MHPGNDYRRGAPTPWLVLRGFGRWHGYDDLQGALRIESNDVERRVRIMVLVEVHVPRSPFVVDFLSLLQEYNATTKRVAHGARRARDLNDVF